MGLGLCACVLQTSPEREGAVFVLGAYQSTFRRFDVQ